MHSNPHAHNLRLSHTRLVTVYGHGLWRIDLAAGLKCFYLFGLQRPHEHLQWNRCVKRERSAAGCVCVCVCVWHTELCSSWCCLSLSLSMSVFCLSPGLFLSGPLSCFPAIVCSCFPSVLSVSLAHSLSLSILLSSVWLGLFVFEVRNAIWLVNYKTRVKRAHDCKTSLPFVFLSIKFKWTPLTTLSTVLLHSLVSCPAVCCPCREHPNANGMS